MNVGDLFKDVQGLRVITKIENGEVVKHQSIDDYICDNAVVVDLQGNWKTIRGIIEERKELYLLEHKIINE